MKRDKDRRKNTRKRGMERKISPPWDGPSPTLCSHVSSQMHPFSQFSELGFATATKCILDPTNGDSVVRVIRMKVKAEILKNKNVISPEKRKIQTEEKNPRAELTQFTPQKQGHPDLCRSRVLGLWQKINPETVSSLFSKKQRKEYTSLS